MAVLELRMQQYFKVFRLTCAVVVPFALLSSLAIWEMDRSARADIERTIGGKVDACMAAIDREISRHAAVLQTLGAAMDGDLQHLRGHAAGVFKQMEGEWMTIVLAQGARQIFNLRLGPGEPLPPSRDPVANRRTVERQTVQVAGVAIDRARLAEPFVTVRAPVRKVGGDPTDYVLISAVRAWVFTLVVKQCGVPDPQWRIGVIDTDSRIVARSPALDPNDERIGRMSSPSYRQGVASGERFFQARTVDDIPVFAGVATSARYGWVLSLTVPAAQIDAEIRRVWLATGSIAGGGLMIAALTCVMALRAYGRAATTRRLEAALTEQSVLMREIHHRVKNNLQSVWGMMQFEKSRISDAYAKTRLEVIMSRILVLGSIHEQLYRLHSLSRIQFGGHLLELVERVQHSLDPEKVRLELDVETLYCDIETALPLGLITFELIANATKHAFPGDRKGTVTVYLGRYADDAVRLGVYDDGVGKQEDTAPGIGMVLVGLLASQVEASVNVTCEDGCRVCVTIPGRFFFDEGDATV